MTYQCNDCSYTHPGVFPGGKCPACDSFNISTRKTATDAASPQQTGRWRLAILLALWGVLLTLLYQKLAS